MYGIVNKAIQGLVTDNYGLETWNKIKEKSKVEADYFLNNESYPDETTFNLANSASEYLNIDIKDVFIAFGEYWILKTGQESYGSLMKAGGNNLKEFIINLPNFHSRVMLIYPNLTPPEFKITDIEEFSVTVHYISSREGLQFFMYGLLQGLGKLFKTNINIEIIASKLDGAKHDVFKISWN
jgi:hypothetical protein